MLIFDERYNMLVDKYIVPVTSYNIAYTKMKKAALKDLLVEKAKNIIVDSTTTVTFFFNKDDLLKALINDTNHFLIRSLLQLNASHKMHLSTEDAATNWNIVTDYYYSFFVAGLLLRLCHRGTFFFDDQTKRKITSVINAFTGKTYVIGSNCAFKITLNEKDSEYSMSLTTCTQKTHELVWVQVSALLSDIMLLSGRRSDEFTLLQKLSEVNQKQGSTFPSQLRNKVNYQPHYGAKETDRDYHHHNPSMLEGRWLDPILTFTERSDDDQMCINLFTAYVGYLQTLTFNLLHAYFERRGRGNGVISSINKNRISKLSPPPVRFTY